VVEVRACLFHRVSGENDGAAVADAKEDIPQLPPRLRIEARRRLVEEYHRRVADQRDRHREPPLHTTADAPSPRTRQQTYEQKEII
jgi:hypothetical protein